MIGHLSFKGHRRSRAGQCYLLQHVLSSEYRRDSFYFTCERSGCVEGLKILDPLNNPRRHSEDPRVVSMDTSLLARGRLYPHTRFLPHFHFVARKCAVSVYVTDCTFEVV
jgi:hypothetical protein